MIYTKKWKLMKLMIKTDIYIVLKKINEIQEILIAERDKRNELCIKYNSGVNIISVIIVV